MSVFITQGRFTEDAIKGMLARPEDRAEALGQLLAASGAKLIGYYMTFGEYDFLIIAEGSTDEATTPLIVAAASGGVTNLKTTMALTSSEMKLAFEKAGHGIQGRGRQNLEYPANNRNRLLAEKVSDSRVLKPPASKWTRAASVLKIGPNSPHSASDP